jgi:putative transposase
MGRIGAKRKGLSKRRICSYLGFRRGVLYDKYPDDNRWHSDEIVVQMMKKVRQSNAAWGFRLIFAYLKSKGEIIGKRRSHRLYMQAKLSLHRNPKKPRLKRVFQKLLPPDQINEGWAMDFLSEWVIGEKQQSVRIINVVDECSRKDLWIEAAHNINAGKLIEVLDKIVEMRGLPRYIRCDNGPEFISAKLKEWASDKVEIKFIQPGKPTQNGIIERLNGTVRKECLNLNWFHSLDEVNDLLGNWYKNYNFDRPHSSLKYKTPVTFENLNQNLYFKMAPENEG